MEPSTYTLTTTPDVESTRPTEPQVDPDEDLVIEEIEDTGFVCAMMQDT